jgi:HSP20 family protein
MSEVKVMKENPIVKPEANDFFAPILPFGRFFGVRPFALMREFTDEMDRMFKGAPLAEGAEGLRAWTPVVDIARCNGDLVVTAELPGLKKEEVKVALTEDALVIEGERKREHKIDHEGYHKVERSYGKFYRSIPLPKEAKTDLAKAELTEGILKVTVPVDEAKPKTREIPIAA